jgi:hypothetical protein
MKSQRQFILETLLPYKNDPTTCAREANVCKFLTEDGRKCAVGKHMKKGPWQNKTMGVYEMDISLGLEKVLNESALNQNFTIEQWIIIQDYHDTCSGQRYRYQKIIQKQLNEIVLELEESLDIELTELKFYKQ